MSVRQSKVATNGERTSCSPSPEGLPCRRTRPGRCRKDGGTAYHGGPGGIRPERGFGPAGGPAAVSANPEGTDPEGADAESAHPPGAGPAGKAPAGRAPAGSAPARADLVAEIAGDATPEGAAALAAIAEDPGRALIALD